MADQEEDRTNEKLVTIFKAANTEQATILKNLLETQDIQAFVTNESVERLIGFESTWQNAPAVQVYGSDAEFAREIAVEIESRQLEAIRTEEIAEQMMAEPELEWNKEQCQSCKAPRHVICPGCEISGTDFDPAEFEEFDEADADIDEGKEELRLMCTVCDKSFEPQYVRHCAKCGHDYGDGVEIQQEEVVSDPASSKRVAIILTLMVLGAIGGIIWFVVVTQKS